MGGTGGELPAYDVAMQSDAVVLVAPMFEFGWVVNLLLFLSLSVLV